MYKASETRYETMPYFRCGKSGLRLPGVSLGLWHNFGDTANYETMKRLRFAAFDHGITHFDLANNYGPPPGTAEENFGRILRENFRAYRDELIVTTKAGYLMWDGPLWGMGKQETSSRQSGPKPETSGTSLCGHLLSSPDGPGHAAGRIHGRVGDGGFQRKGALCRPLQLRRPDVGKGGGDSLRFARPLRHQPEPLFHFRPDD